MDRRGLAGPETETAGVHWSLLTEVGLTQGEGWSLPGAEVRAGDSKIHPASVCYLPRQAVSQTRLARLSQLNISQLVSLDSPAPPAVPANIQPLLDVLHIVWRQPSQLKPLYFLHQILQEMEFPASRQAVDNLVLLGENKLYDPLLLSQNETLGRAELDCE